MAKVVRATPGIIVGRLPEGLGYVDRAYVKTRLEAAGLTLMCLPAHGTAPAKLKAAWPTIVQSVWDTCEAKGEAIRIKPPLPSNQAITQMDEALGWIPLVGPDAIQTRRLLWLCALVWPITEKPVWPMRKLAKVFDLDRETIVARHQRGLDRIALRLNDPNWREPPGAALP